MPQSYVQVEKDLVGATGLIKYLWERRPELLPLLPSPCDLRLKEGNTKLSCTHMDLQKDRFQSFGVASDFLKIWPPEIRSLTLFTTVLVLWNVLPGEHISCQVRIRNWDEMQDLLFLLLFLPSNILSVSQTLDKYAPEMFWYPLNHPIFMLICEFEIKMSLL